MEVDSDDGAPTVISGLLKRQNPPTSIRTIEGVCTPLPEKSKFAKDDCSGSRVPAGSSALLGSKPNVARATEKKILSANLNSDTQPLIRRQHKNRTTDDSLYDYAVIGPYGVL